MTTEAFHSLTRLGFTLDRSRRGTSMRRRLLVIAAIALLGIATVLVCLWCSRPRYWISQETSEKIVEGLTEEQLITIIGFPPGDYTTGPVRLVGDHKIQKGQELLEGMPKGWKVWVTDNAAVVVHFDGRGTASAIEIGWFVEPVTARLRRWLRIE